MPAAGRAEPWQILQVVHNLWSRVQGETSASCMQRDIAEPLFVSYVCVFYGWEDEWKEEDKPWATGIHLGEKTTILAWESRVFAWHFSPFLHVFRL